MNGGYEVGRSFGESIMKDLKRVGALVWVLLAGAGAHAQVVLTYDYSGINTVIPDGDLSGWSDTRTVTTPHSSILSVSVTLTLEGTGGGAFNGDYYAYLSHEGTLAVLLNRVGVTDSNTFGYEDNGFANLTFRDDAANGDVHLYQGVVIPSGNGALTGTWAPDGRNVSPLSVTDTTPRTATLGGLTGLNPNGEWTLFIADASGGGTARLTDWSMNIVVAAVPEPETYAGVGGALLMAFAVLRRWRLGRKG